jgi:hypothetical protein
MRLSSTGLHGFEAEGPASVSAVRALVRRTAPVRCSAIGLAVWLLGLCMALPSVAWAYVDPGSGSMLLQFLLATVLGALYVLRSYFRKLRGWLMRRREPVAPSAAPGGTEPSAPREDPAPTESHD